MHRRTRTIALAAGLAALLTVVAACGTERAADAPPGSAAGIVALQMQDIKFDTTTLTVDAGQTIQFQFTNAGQVIHDAFVGDAAAQAEHDKEMAEMAGMSDMSGHSADEPAVTVEPGKTATLSYTFDRPGTYEIGCHQPGHYAAGMKVTVTVLE